MVSFTNHYNAISIDRLPRKLKLENINDTLIILFYVSPRSFLFLLKTKKKTSTAAVDPRHLKVKVAD